MSREEERSGGCVDDERDDREDPIKAVLARVEGSGVRLNLKWLRASEKLAHLMVPDRSAAWYSCHRISIVMLVISMLVVGGTSLYGASVWVSDAAAWGWRIPLSITGSLMPGLVSVLCIATLAGATPGSMFELLRSLNYLQVSDLVYLDKYARRVWLVYCVCSVILVISMVSNVTTAPSELVVSTVPHLSDRVVQNEGLRTMFSVNIVLGQVLHTLPVVYVYLTVTIATLALKRQQRRVHDAVFGVREASVDPSDPRSWSLSLRELSRDGSLTATEFSQWFSEHVLEPIADISVLARPCYIVGGFLGLFLAAVSAVSVLFIQLDSTGAAVMSFYVVVGTVMALVALVPAAKVHENVALLMRALLVRTPHACEDKRLRHPTRVIPRDPPQMLLAPDAVNDAIQFLMAARDVSGIRLLPGGGGLVTKRKLVELFSAFSSLWFLAYTSLKGGNSSC